MSHLSRSRSLLSKEHQDSGEESGDDYEASGTLGGLGDGEKLVVDINSADRDQLVQLEGIGWKRADAILRGRSDHPLTLEDMGSLEIPSNVWEPLVRGGSLVFHSGGARNFGFLPSKENTGNLHESGDNSHQDQSDMQGLVGQIMQGMRSEMSAMGERFEKNLQERDARLDQRLKAMGEHGEKGVSDNVASSSRAGGSADPARGLIDRLVNVSRMKDNARQFTTPGRPSLNNNVFGDNSGPQRSGDVPQVAADGRSMGAFGGWYGRERGRTPEYERDQVVGRDQPRRREESESPERRFRAERRPYSRHADSDRSKKDFIGGKMAHFNGDETSDWASFIMQFGERARRREWDNDSKLGALVDVLRSKALKFYSNAPESARSSYTLLVKCLEKRFGRKDPPTTVRRKLQHLTQADEESLEAFAERVLTLVQDGFPESDEDLVQSIGVDTFLKGCREKEAAFDALSKEPTTVHQALEMVDSATHNYRAIFGNAKKVRTLKSGLGLVVGDDCVEGTEKVRAVTVADKGESQLSQISSTLEKLVKLMSEKSVSFKTPLVQPNTNNVGCYTCGGNHFARECPKNGGRSRSPSPGACYRCGNRGHQIANCPQRSRSPSPHRGRGCYTCGKDGHLARDCPEKAVPAVTKDNKSLNC